MSLALRGKNVRMLFVCVPGIVMIVGVGSKKLSAFPLIDELLVKDIAVPIRLIGDVVHQGQHMQFSDGQ